MKISEQIDNVENRIGGQFDLIVCTMTLVGNGVLSLDDTMQRANRYWTEDVAEACENCPCFETCFLVKWEA